MKVEYEPMSREDLILAELRLIRAKPNSLQLLLRILAWIIFVPLTILAVVMVVVMVNGHGG